MIFIFNRAGVVALLSVALSSACSDSASNPSGGAGAAGRDGASGGPAIGEGGEAGEGLNRAGSGSGEQAGEAGADSIPGDAGASGEPSGGAEQAGAGGTAGSAGIAGTGGVYDGPLMIPCNVNVVYGICQSCHSNPTLNEAPFPLITLDDMKATRLAQIGAVSSGSMPKDGALAPEDKTLLLAWLNAGAQGVPQAACP